jgi:hypothetical protein
MEMKKTGVMVVVLACSIVMWTACSTAWIGEAEQIVAVLVPAIANLMTVIGTLQGNVSASDLQGVQSAGAQAGADLQLLESLIAQYQKADAAAQPGLLNQINAALTAEQASLSSILPALHIKDAATQAKVTAVLQLLISEVQSMAAIVPLVSSGSPATMRTMEEARKQAPLSADEFIKSYNATMTARTGNSSLNRATARLKIHGHGKFARWASAGLLK